MSDLSPGGSRADVAEGVRLRIDHDRPTAGEDQRKRSDPLRQEPLQRGSHQAASAVPTSIARRASASARSE
jgi:hypothetical protein